MAKTLPVVDRILAALPVPGIPDYAFLGSDAALKAYPDALTLLLQRAKENVSALERVTDPTFATLVQPLLSSDGDLSLLWGFLDQLNHTDGTPVTQKIMEEFQPNIIAQQASVMRSAVLYRGLLAVRKRGKLDAAQARSLHLLIQGMEMSGVHLPDAEKARLQAIDERLEALAESFMRNTVESRKKFFRHFETDEHLREMPPQSLDAARAEAKARKLPGWVFTLSPPSLSAVLTYCSDRKTRRDFALANASVATDGPTDNRPLILEILRLRREKARMLGKKTFVEYALQDRMARTPAEIKAFLKSYAVACKRKAAREVKELQAFSGLKKLERWDMSYEGEKLQKKRYAIDDRELREYFPLEQVLDGMFAVAKKLYDVRLRRVRPPLHAKDIRAFEVSRGTRKIGYFLLDLYAKPQKRSGAWAACLRSPDASRSQLPILINVINAQAPVGRSPVLLRHDDVQTIFHEFGHALHVLLSSSPYGNLYGFLCEWDFMELPSQIMENWCWEPQALTLYARHAKTGKPLPDPLLRSLRRSREFLAGYFGLAHTMHSFLDLALHLDEPPETPAALDTLCRRIYESYAVLPVHKESRMHAAFSHLFAGGYAAGYYSYVWAEILEADIFARIKRDGMLSRKAGEAFRKGILAQGTLKPGAELFRAYMGRDPSITPLLRKHGLQKA
jgi:oligopeptidase A